MVYNKVFSSLVAVILSIMLSSLDISSVTSGHAFAFEGIVVWPMQYLDGTESIDRFSSTKISEYASDRFVLPVNSASVHLSLSPVRGQLQDEEPGIRRRYDQVQKGGFESSLAGESHLVEARNVPASNPPVSLPSIDTQTLGLSLKGTLLGEDPSDLLVNPSISERYEQPLGSLIFMDDQSSFKRAIPAVINIQYNKFGYYDARNTWKGVDEADLLARAMLAEENEKLLDPHRMVDFIGAGWVMVNRTRANDGYFDYAEGSLYRALTPYQQFALGGFITKSGEVFPGNVIFVANPLAWPAWFGGDPVAAYWKAVEIAEGILNGAIPDPTFGALYFADAYLDDYGNLIPFPDGRTRFWYMESLAYTIDELSSLDSPPWP